MWIKTQQGELLNFDRLLSVNLIDVGKAVLVQGDPNFNCSITLGRFNSRAEAEAYFNQLEYKLTGAPINFNDGEEVPGLDDIRNITLEETNHD